MNVKDSTNNSPPITFTMRAQRRVSAKIAWVANIFVTLLEASYSSRCFWYHLISFYEVHLFISDSDVSLHLSAPFLHECMFLVVNAAWFHIHPIYVFTQSIMENFFWNHSSSRHHTLEVRKELQHDRLLVTTTLGSDISQLGNELGIFSEELYI